MQKQAKTNSKIRLLTVAIESAIVKGTKYIHQTSSVSVC